MLKESRKTFLQKLEEQKAGEVRNQNGHAVAHADAQVKECAKAVFANLLERSLTAFGEFFGVLRAHQNAETRAHEHATGGLVKRLRLWLHRFKNVFGNVEQKDDLFTVYLRGKFASGALAV